MDMDAELADTHGHSVMTALYLPDVVKDYADTDEVSGEPHRYGCSGIDGTAYGPVFGAAPDSQKKIMICYGIYGDVDREDNDHQVILQFDPSMPEVYGRPLSQAHPHHSGCPCEARYLFHTGNTTYGVQNLEYDPHTRTYLAAVYPGRKEEYTNYPLFFIDAAAAPVEGEPAGRRGERSLLLSPASPGLTVDPATVGCWFGLGQTGVYAFGDGRYAFSRPVSRTEGGKFPTHASEVYLYRFDGGENRVFGEL